MTPSTTRLVPIALAQGFGVACGVMGVKVNSHVLPPDVLGAYGVFLTFTPIGLWIVHAGIVKFVARNWEGSPARAALFRFALRLWFRRLPWLALAALPAAVALAPLAGTGIALAWLGLFPAAALLALGALAQSALQAERAHWRDCLVSICGSLTRTFLPPVAFLALSASVPALWAGFGAHAVVLAAAGLLGLRRCWKIPAGSPAAPPLGSAYAGPLFILLAAAGWLAAGLNRWLVAGFFGETEAGYFTLAGGAAVVLTSTLGTVCMQYAQPGFFALGNRTETHRALAQAVDRIALLYTVAGLVAVAGFSALAPWLVGPLIDERYRGALAWILPAGSFGVATIVMAFYHSLLLAGRRERACGPVELPTLAVLVAGCIVGAACGRLWFSGWLLASPLVPWLIARPLARRHLFTPDATPAPAPAR